MKRKKPSINQTMTNSPGGVQAGGDVTINPSLVPRRISEEARPRIIAMLSQRRTKVEVLAPANNDEALRLAMDVYEVLTRAGWDMQGEPVRSFITVGGPTQPGILIKMAGEPLAPSAPLTISKDDPVGVLAEMFRQLNFLPVHAQRYKDIPAGTINIEIGPPPNE